MVRCEKCDELNRTLLKAGVSVPQEGWATCPKCGEDISSRVIVLEERLRMIRLALNGKKSEWL